MSLAAAGLSVDHGLVLAACNGLRGRQEKIKQALKINPLLTLVCNSLTVSTA
jgi:hypothetical protein